MKTHNRIEKLLVIENKKERLKKELKEDWERKSPEFQQFLAKQVFLPPEKWDEKFKDYIEKKCKFSREKTKALWGATAETIKEMHFNRYLKELDLNKCDLTNKKILDLGCGEEGSFVKYCLEKGITTDIYGLDLKINPDELDEKYKKYLLKGDFTKKIPGENYDYITTIGSIGGYGEGSDGIKKNINLAVDGLKDGGELRISGIWDSLEAREKGIWFAKKDWQDIIEDLAKEKKIEYKFQPIDIRVSGNKGIILDEVLIIKKKK